MNEFQQQQLEFYLERTGQINAYLPFDEWYQRHSGDAMEAEFKTTLELANEFIKGYEAGWKAHRDHVATEFDALPDTPRPPFSAE